MKREVKDVNGRHYIIETFNSSNEMIKVNNSRKQNFGEARTSDCDSWRGASWNEAINMLQYGWDKPVKQIKSNIKKLEKQGTMRKITFQNDVIGFAPNVPNAILGLPQSMINSHVSYKKAKVINVMIDPGASCGVSSDRIIEYGSKVIEKLYSLEKAGFRVRIEVLYSFNGKEWEPNTCAMKYLLKSENQPFDLKRMAFPMAHTAMFRRIAFDWYERLPEAKELDGYGTPLKNNDDRDDIKQVLCSDKNTYLILHGDDLDEMFKNIK